MGKSITYLKENLRYYRKQLNLSQQLLAEKSEISIHFVQEIELGRKQPSLTTLDKLAYALNIEAYKLLMNPEKNDNELVKGASMEIREEINSYIDKLIKRY